MGIDVRSPTAAVGLSLVLFGCRTASPEPVAADAGPSTTASSAVAMPGAAVDAGEPIVYDEDYWKKHHIPTMKLDGGRRVATNLPPWHIASAPARWKTLTTTGTLKKIPAGSIHLQAVGDRIVAWNDAGSARVYVADKDEPVAELDVDGLAFTSTLAGPLLVGRTPSTVSGFDARTLAKKLSAPLVTTSVQRAVSTSRRVVLAITTQSKSEVVGIDVASGKVVWRATATGPATVRLAGALVAWGDEGHVTVVDPDTGAKKWTHDVPGARLVAADAKRVLTSGMRTTELDVATGNPAEITDIVRSFDAVVIDGDAAFGAHRGGGTNRLLSFDLEQENPAWDLRHEAHGDAPLGLTVDDDAVYAWMGDGVVTAYDRRLQSVRATWPCQAQPEVAFLHEPSFTLYLACGTKVEVLRDPAGSGTDATDAGADGGHVR